MTTLHLVRRGREPLARAGDWVVELDRRELVARGNPPLPPGPISDDQLATLVFAADRVVTW